MENDYIEQALKEYIVKEFLYDKAVTDLDNNLPLIQKRIIDSIGIVMLVSFIESQFGVSIEVDDVVPANFETIDSIKKLILDRRQATL